MYPISLFFCDYFATRAQIFSSRTNDFHQNDTNFPPKSTGFVQKAVKRQNLFVCELKRNCRLKSIQISVFSPIFHHFFTSSVRLKSNNVVRTDYFFMYTKKIFKICKTLWAAWVIEGAVGVCSLETFFFGLPSEAHTTIHWGWGLKICFQRAPLSFMSREKIYSRHLSHPLRTKARLAGQRLGRIKIENPRFRFKRDLITFCLTRSCF